jgi:hypothetical protein
MRLPGEIAEGKLGSDACRVSSVTQISFADFVPGVKRLTDSREILLLTTAEGYIFSAKADVRQPIAADCHSVPFA